MNFTQIPAWTLPAKADALALFEVMALAGLEDKWIRLDADTQRRVMGSAIFGKQEIMVCADGTVKVARSVCFGTMKEVGEYVFRHVFAAIERHVKLSPGVFGKRYL
jgi:hypothetical protein